MLSDQFIEHRLLSYKFIHKKIELRERETEYLNILKKHKIDIVLDLTNEESIPILESTNKAGISYLNTAMNNEVKNVDELIYDIFSRKKEINKAAHILCTGMNPGIVNMWVRHGIEKFSKPKEIIHFEYDTSKAAKEWCPLMTWSVHEYLIETVRSPGGIAYGNRRIKQLLPNALKNRINMASILSPIIKLNEYPRGFEVLHEENVTLSKKYDIPSRFIYAVNMKTMEYLAKLYSQKKDISEKDLILGDNTSKILEGADSIGVLLEYEDKKVYYFNSVPNIAVIGTSATYSQVVTGIFSALFVLIFDKLNKEIHFVEDLYDTHFKYYMFDNMRVQEFVFKKENKKLKLVSYNPYVRLKRNNHFEHLYI